MGPDAAREPTLIIAVDFDGTIVDHRFPDIGEPVPGAFHWLARFAAHGAKLILYTMRSDGQLDGDVLTAANVFCEENGISFWAINHNPEQAAWTSSPKVYAHIYIDDAAAGVPLRENPRMGGRPFVDWDAIGPAILKTLIDEQAMRPATESSK